MLTYRAEAFVTSSMAYLLHPLKSNITKTENIIMKYGCNVIFENLWSWLKMCK